MKQMRLHDPNASTYKKGPAVQGSLPLEPTALGSLLGGNYQFLLYPSLYHSLPVMNFTLGEMNLGLLILVCHVFFTFPSDKDTVDLLW